MTETERNRRLVERFCTEVITGHRLDGLDRFLHEDYIQHNADCPQGRSGFVEFFTTIFRAVPDFRYELIRILADGDRVWVHARTLGTHTGGEWLGVAPRGRRLDFEVVDMFRLRDGRIAEHWDVADTHAFFSQLGRFA